jgi:arabinose-5-phosphate isomerase
MPLVSEQAAMSDAILVMTAKRFGCVGIVNDSGALTGIFTDGDLARRMNPDLLSLKVNEVMTRSPKVIEPGQLAAQALARMNSQKITVLFVVDGGRAERRPVGILHMHDCLRAGLQ